MIKYECFINSLCSQIHWLKTCPHDQDATIVEERQKAMVIALHEAGQVIFFERSDFVVVDPNWFCHDVVGEVLSIDEACHIEMHQKKLTIKNDIVERYKLKEFLLNSISIKKKFQPSKGHTNIILNFDNLIEAMIKMHLCFEQDLPNIGSDRLLEQKCNGLFIPIMLPDVD